MKACPDCYMEELLAFCMERDDDSEPDDNDSDNICESERSNVTLLG